jgi:hypothetical protein
MRSGSTQARPMTDEPLDLDKHRGMAAQNATDIRRALAEVENNARDLRERQAILENQLLSVPAASWPEAAGKARYVLNRYASGLPPVDTRHRGSRCGNIRGLCASRSRGLNERDARGIGGSNKYGLAVSR